MHVVSRYTAAEAAATIDPRGRAIALSVVIAAGALLLIMPPVIGVTGTLSLLTALIAAFGVGWGFTRGQSWLYRSPLAATRWAFLLSAAGWLLALVACGRYRNVAEVSRAMLHIQATVQPDPELTALYDARYAEFKQISPACRPLFASLAGTP